jgi:hypothetical protein
MGGLGARAPAPGPRATAEPAGGMEVQPIAPRAGTVAALAAPAGDCLLVFDFGQT